MNTLRILKGKDITITVDGTVLCFVTDFVAHESEERYEIEEILNSDAVDSVQLRKSYELNITALTHFNKKVFEKQPFTLRVCDGDTAYEYVSCRLKSYYRDVNSSKPIVDKYTIVAQDMKVLEGQYER
ncbi:MAG: hypothetical protein E7513_05980 [Ruminococcaceae bacterium]|nr:hypothetical protein [Oscillospiraceae bacterium]